MRKVVNTLSPTEQKLYSTLYQKRIITTEDVVKILKELHKSADYITNLREKGFLQKIKQGVYAIVPPNMIGNDTYLPDKFLIAAHLKKKYYISHHSALELHGLAESLFNKVYITLLNYSQSFEYKGITYTFVSTKHFFGIERIAYKSVNISISDLEKTVLDCIRNIHFTGGLEELVKSISGIPSLNYEKILDYLEQFNEQILYHKTGFLLECVKDLSPPKKFLNTLKEHIGKKVYYLDKEKTSAYNKKWNIMVPKNFLELTKIA